MNCFGDDGYGIRIMGNEWVMGYGVCGWIYGGRYLVFSVRFLFLESKVWGGWGGRVDGFYC